MMNRLKTEPLVTNTETTAVVLLNLGGPERLEDVAPFLFNLFSDRQIIRLGPWFMQKPLAWWIARRRAPKSRESYRQIGGGSPLGKITSAQGQALEEELNRDGSFLVFCAMRYWRPSALETLAAIRDAGIKKVVALTLYPHYSIATTGSSLSDLRQAAASLGDNFEIREIAAWPEQPAYIRALAVCVTEGLAGFGGEEVQVVYSAHSLPVQFIEEGDPYLDDLGKTIRALEKITGVAGELCFQSRSGPVRWLTPSTPEKLQELAQQGCRNILMVPISFVSDHVETLYEIDILYARMAADLGMRLQRSPSLNLRPDFIAALKDLVLAGVTGKE